MNRTIKRNYDALRRYWNEPAARALRMAKDRAAADDAGIKFCWELEDESPVDVFGEPSRYECETCGSVFYAKGDCPRCARGEARVTFVDTGVYYDPTAEHYVCIARGPTGEHLDSLGMIDGAELDANGRCWPLGDIKTYAWYVECEIAGDALAEWGKIANRQDTAETEETLA